MKVRNESALKRTRQGDFKVKYVPTGSMIAAVLTKPLRGNLFARMTKMNRGGCRGMQSWQGSFGSREYECEYPVMHVMYI